MYDWFFIQYTLLDFMALLWTNKKRKLFLYKTITLQLYSLTWVILDLSVWIRKDVLMFSLPSFSSQNDLSQFQCRGHVQSFLMDKNLQLLCCRNNQLRAVTFSSSQLVSSFICLLNPEVPNQARNIIVHPPSSGWPRFSQRLCGSVTSRAASLDRHQAASFMAEGLTHVQYYWLL